MSWLNSIKDKYFTREQDKKPAKRSPKEIIENTKNTKIEHAYVKFPGGELTDVTYSSNEGKAIEDSEKINELMNRSGKTNYRQGHTHIKGEGSMAHSAIPSLIDVRAFLRNEKAKSLFIAQTDETTGKLGGYFVLRKPSNESYQHADLSRYATFLSNFGNKNSVDELKELFRGYNLQFKIIPASGFRLSTNGGIQFKKIGSSLETKLAVSISVLVLAIALLFYSNFTGFAIANLNTKSLNILGGSLFIVGLISLFFTLKKSEQKKRK